jgi:hypothetical protein
LKLTPDNYNFIPPRPLDYLEAARLLMEKRHVVFMGVADIAEHRSLFEQLARAFPGRCALLYTQPQWQRTPDKMQKCLVYRAIDNGGRTFTVMFIPDGAEARLAMAVAAWRLSRELISATLSRLSAEAPIALLDSPRHFDNPTLHEGYAAIVSALEMTFQGRAVDLSLN